MVNNPKEEAQGVCAMGREWGLVCVGMTAEAHHALKSQQSTCLDLQAREQVPEREGTAVLFGSESSLALAVGCRVELGPQDLQLVISEDSQ